VNRYREEEKVEIRNQEHERRVHELQKAFVDSNIYTRGSETDVKELHKDPHLVKQ
jgi:hypothetical protein